MEAPNESGAQLNTSEVADNNWRVSTRVVVNLVRSQVYHNERAAARSPCCSASRGVCQRQLILVGKYSAHFNHE